MTRVDPRPADAYDRPVTLPSLKSAAPNGVEKAPAGAPEASPAAALPVAGERLLHGGEIARGGMASIGVAFDQALLRRVAVKRLRGPSDATSRRRFMEEAQVTAQLDHPNVVPVHDLATDAATGQAYFTMKLVEGHTLGQFIDELHRHELTP